MSFKIERNDITRIHADAIVNTANPRPIIGGGTDAVIYKAAGWEKLLSARQSIGDIPRGESRATDSFNLKTNGIKYIIHTIGIHYKDGRCGEEEILRNCYKNSFNLALQLNCESVAIPLLASGYYEFPKEIALRIAVEEINRFLLESELNIILVVYDEQSYLISERLFNDIKDYLNENFVEFSKKDNNTIPENDKFPDTIEALVSWLDKQMDFRDTLQALIAAKKLGNITVYKRAAIDRKLFSKIINPKVRYHPSKDTVMALGLALELPILDYEKFLATAGYALMPSTKFDMIVKFCVIKGIYNIIEVDYALFTYGCDCFAPE